MKTLLSLFAMASLLLTSFSALASNHDLADRHAEVREVMSDFYNKLSRLNDTEYEQYLIEAAGKLEKGGNFTDAEKLRLMADASLRGYYLQMIRKTIDERSENGLLLGFAIVGCASIVLCPIWIFLAICTFGEQQAASDI